MSSISSYLTTNNVVYASAVCTLGAIFGTTNLVKSEKLRQVIGGATLAGITAVVIKERSFQSSKWPVSIIGGIFIRLLITEREYLTNEHIKPFSKIKHALFLVSASTFLYAPISIIVTVGARIFRPMQQS